MSKVLTISYSVAGPNPSTPSGTPSSATLSYPLVSNSPHSHLEALEVALGTARTELNVVLSEWKEVLGEKKDKKEAEGFEEEEEE